MPIGFCRLCNRESELRKSHVFPKFAHRDYVTDRAAGGRFVDLQHSKRHSRQFTRPWFCQECEQRLSVAENDAAQMLRRCRRDTVKHTAYSRRFLYFATSLSWRIVLYNQSMNASIPLGRSEKRAIEKWKRFLQGGKSNVRPYSQHAFIIEDSLEDDADWSQILGGEIFGSPLPLTLARVGPLIIVGLMDKRMLSIADQIAWRKSEVSPAGGVLPVIQKERPDPAIPTDLSRVLNDHEARCIRQAAKVPFEAN